MNETFLSNYPDILSVHDIQTVLNIGRVGVYKLLHNKELRGFKIGNTYKIPKTSLLDYIRENTNSIIKEV